MHVPVPLIDTRWTRSCIGTNSEDRSPASIYLPNFVARTDEWDLSRVHLQMLGLQLARAMRVSGIQTSFRSQEGKGVHLGRIESENPRVPPCGNASVS